MEDALVFDVGGTNLRAGRYSFATRKLVRVMTKATPNIWNTQTSDEIPLDALLSKMQELGAELFPEVGPEIVTIGFPGPITPEGEILSTCTIWGDRFTGSRSLVSTLGCIWPEAVVTVMNDVTAAGYFFTRGPGADFCVITVSSGIGSKLFLNGKPYAGSAGRGGEIGHWVTDPGADALNCECGGKGHLGGIASGRGCLVLARKLASDDPARFLASALGKHAGGDPFGIDNELLVEYYLKGDWWTKEVIEKAARELGKAIALIHTAVGIEQFVIIGGFGTALGEAYRKALVRSASDFCWSLGQNWDSMILLGPNDTEIGLTGAGIYSERVKNHEYESRKIQLS